MVVRPRQLTWKAPPLSKMPCLPAEVILGVDTHRDVHAAALVDELGRLIASEIFPTTRRGIRALFRGAQDLGTVHRAGVEGTGSYGAGPPARCCWKGSR